MTVQPDIVLCVTAIRSLLVLASLTGLEDAAAQSQFVPGFGQTSYPFAGSATGEAFDFTGDGAIDSCGVYGTVFEILHVTLNDGTGRFGRADVPMPVVWQFNWIASGRPGLVDVDDDGDIDVFVILCPTVLNTTGTPFAVCLINNGAGGFTVDTADRFGGHAFDPIDSFRAGDFDGDGRGDLLVVRGGYGLGIWLFRNIGGGQFRVVPGAFPPQPTPYYFRETLVVDIDADGDADFLGATQGSAHPPFLFINDSTGHFYQGFAFTGIEAHSAAVGDINGDGHSDILFGSTNPVSLLPELWIADGQGRFFSQGYRFPALWSALQIWSIAQLIDVDHDGDLDLFLHEPSSWFLLNDGNGYFTDGATSLGLAPTGIASYWIGDVDRDGDNDIVSGGNIPTYLNTLRQIITNDPLVGGSLDVDLYARPGHIVTYVLGFVRSDLFLPGIGWYALDPATAVAWPSAAVVDPTGHFRTSLTVPNNPVLRGLALFAQGVEVDTQAQVTLMSVWPFTIR